MVQVHKEVATCDGVNCALDCGIRKLLVEQPEKYGAYLSAEEPTKLGIGSELKAMLEQLGAPACGECAELVRQMDTGGEDWCVSHRTLLVARIDEQARKLGWKQWLAAGSKAFLLGLPMTIEGLLDEAVRRGSVKQAKRWAYGVTTVSSRRKTTLPVTLASLARAGFGKPRLFVDGDKDAGSWEAEFLCETSCRYPPARTAGNWHLALLELYHRKPNADWYGLFQDDCLLTLNAREYVEKSARHLPRESYLNLLNAHDNRPPSSGQQGWYASNGWGRGAVALAFNRYAAMALLSSAHLVTRVQDAHRGWRCIDGGISEAMRQKGYAEYIHHPSLAQHIDGPSSMGNGSYEPSSTFPGERWNALQLLG